VRGIDKVVPFYDKSEYDIMYEALNIGLKEARRVADFI
jgi:hypothetical protein